MFRISAVVLCKVCSLVEEVLQFSSPSPTLAPSPQTSLPRTHSFKTVFSKSKGTIRILKSKLEMTTDQGEAHYPPKGGVTVPTAWGGDMEIEEA